MRRVMGVLGLCLGSLGGCEKTVTFVDPCDEPIVMNELHVVINGAYGFFGIYSIAAGDTLPLVAEVRPAIGSSLDFWGSGTCRTDYGDPVPATIEWSSSNVSVATVTSNGLVRGVGTGDATITARAPERGLFARYDISVWVRRP